MTMRLHLLLVWTFAGCYSGSDAARDVNLAWRGHARAELEARLGADPIVAAQPDGTQHLRWRRTGTRAVSLPSGHLDVRVTPTSFSIDAAARPGVIDRYEYDLASALVDPSGTVLQLDAGFPVGGIPSGMNVRHGVIFGLHGGAGVIGGATGPMPSVGLYIGGMIGPRLALVGSYRFVNGKDEMGYAMGHAWAFGVQQWATSRLSVMAGAAMVLDLEPGLEDAALSPGGAGAVSFALVRSGSFVLDARLDMTVSTSAAFGLFGVGVNVN